MRSAPEMRSAVKGFKSSMSLALSRLMSLIAKPVAKGRVLARVVQNSFHSGTLRAMSKWAHTQTPGPVQPTAMQEEPLVDLSAGTSGLQEQGEAMAGAGRPAAQELGGPAGPEPTRYGDWERKGRCIDF